MRRATDVGASAVESRGATESAGGASPAIDSGSKVVTARAFLLIWRGWMLRADSASAQVGADTLKE
ncbi:hypothetical protein GCM10010457_16300 [Microbacterium keratanolyticum]